MKRVLPSAFFQSWNILKHFAVWWEETGKILLSTTRGQACDDEMGLLRRILPATDNPLRFHPWIEFHNPHYYVLFLSSSPHAIYLRLLLLYYCFICSLCLWNYGLKLITCVFPWNDSAIEPFLKKIIGRWNASAYYKALVFSFRKSFIERRVRFF